MKDLHQYLVSFLVGVVMTTACLLLFLSADLGQRSSAITLSPSAPKIASNVDPLNRTEFAFASKEANTTRKAHHTQKRRTPKSEDLPELLKRAAAGNNKTVLMTTVNEAWAAPNSLLDLFLESFRRGEDIEHLLNHLIIVAMDPKAYDRCRSVHPLCYYLRSADATDFASEQNYMKKNYLEMMWRRNKFQQSILELGYNFLFTDVDILWFRSPFQHLSPSVDLTMGADFFVGDPNSLGNYPNGGLLYVKSSRTTIALYEHWRQARERFPNAHEQYTFNKVKGEFAACCNAKIRFLDTAYFSGFCQHGKDLRKICTMHANCCEGLENKLYDLRNVLEDWKAYKARILDGEIGEFSWRVPGRCMH